MLNHLFNYSTVQLLLRFQAIASLFIYSYIISASDIGVVAISATMVTMLSVLLPMNLHVGVGRFLFDPDIDNQVLLGTIFITIVIVASFLSVLWILFSGITSSFLQIPRSIVLAQVGISVAIISETIFTQISIYNKESRRLLFYSAFKTIPVLLISVSMILFLDYPKPETIIITELIFGLIGLGYIVRKLSNLARFKFCLRYLKIVSSFSFPLILHGISLALISQIDRIFLARLTDLATVGIYSVCYLFAASSLFFATPLLNTFQPRFFETMNEGDKETASTDSYAIVAVLLFLSVGIGCFGPKLLNIVLSDEYSEGLRIIPVVAAGAFAQSFFMVWARVLAFYNQTKIIALIVTSAAVANVFLNLFFIPFLGLTGAALATFFSQLLMILLVWVQLTKNLRFSINIGKSSVLVFVFFFVLTPINSFLSVDYIALVGIFSIPFLIYFLKPELGVFYSMVRSAS